MVRCRKCGGRIFTNVNHCPYCGKAVKPFFLRLWFWLLLVVLLGLGTFIFIRYFLPKSVEEPDGPITPIVVGAPAGASYHVLPVNTTVDCNNLLVTVTSVRSDMTAADGSPIYSVDIQFFNKAEADVSVYSTQWLMRAADGSTVDCYFGKTSDGLVLDNDIDVRKLSPGEQYSATLHFSGEGLNEVVFAPNALSFNEEELVSWVMTASSSAAQTSSDGE
jgi:hypothetical protein